MSLLTELEALAHDIDFEWDGDNNMHDAAACIRTLIAAEKARLEKPIEDRSGEISFTDDDPPDPLLVQAREALERVRRYVETDGSVNLQVKVGGIAGNALAALDVRLGGKA